MTRRRTDGKGGPSRRNPYYGPLDGRGLVFGTTLGKEVVGTTPPTSYREGGGGGVGDRCREVGRDLSG